MAPKSTQKCPQCGTVAQVGQNFCGFCRQRLTFCQVCSATNLAWSRFCHNCGKALGAPPAVREGAPRPSVPSQVPPARTVKTNDEIDKLVMNYLQEHRGEMSTSRASQELHISQVDLTQSISRLQGHGLIQREAPPIERMRVCASCKKTIGEGEPFCSYCGSKQVAHTVEESQTPLDPHALEVGLKMRDMILGAKDHEEYSYSVDKVTTEMGKIALGEEKSKELDADQLHFQDQLRLLTLVFEYARDYVPYKGETFGEHIRWPWETMETGGDCDCKIVLLASMLDCLAFRRMYLRILPPGTYRDSSTKRETRMQGHVILEVELKGDETGSRRPVLLDPSCTDCDVNEIPESLKSFLLYSIPVIP